MSATIPRDEVLFHPSSYCDSNGRLFTWRDGLYRGITARGAAACRRLFDEGIAEELTGKGLLVESELTDLVLEGFPLVVRHRRLPFVSFPFEWCFEQLQDVALVIADLELELAGRGFTVFDCDGWNVVFDGPRPMYVDLSSIVQDEPRPWGGWGPDGDFVRKLVNPLQLMALGHGHAARWLLHDRDGGVLSAELDALVGWRLPRRRARRLLQHASAAAARRRPELTRLRATTVSALARMGQNGAAAADSNIASVRRLREEVARIRPPARRDGAEVQPPFEPSETWTPRQRAVDTALHELHPASALHLDHGDSWFGELAARSRIPTVVLADDGTVSRLVARAKADDLLLHPLVVEVRSPSPGYGIANRELPAATERLASELVIALDVVANLATGDAIESALDATQIADSVAAFSTRRALVEVGLDLNGRRADHAAQLRPALARRFRAVDVYAELGEKALLVCEK